MPGKELFREFLLRKGLKSTRQREVILDEFLRCASHPSTEELYLRLRKKHPGDRLRHGAPRRSSSSPSAASPRNATSATARPATSRAASEEHHDHLICRTCGAIIEFEDPRIEQLQNEVAARHGFVIENHRLELYGRCGQCAAG